MSRRVRYALLSAFLVVVLAWWWAMRRTGTLEGELVDDQGNPVPRDSHHGLWWAVALVVLVTVVIPTLRTALAAARRRRRAVRASRYGTVGGRGRS